MATHLIRNSKSGESVVFRIRLSNADLARVMQLLGSEATEHQIMRWSKEALLAALDNRFVIHSRIE